MEKRELLKAVIDKHYQELLKIEKPKPGKIGGTYYGSTELISSVGNHLEIFEGNHNSYFCGMVTRYKDVYGIRIGSAYQFSPSEIINELKAVLIEDTEWNIFCDIGTNYSNIGFGKIVRRDK